MRLGTGRERARSEVVVYCRRMLAERLVDFTAGNISVRVDGEPGLYAVTPSGAPYDTLEPADVCLATIDGELVAGRTKPTTEFPLHTLIYRRRPEVGAIVHTHSGAAMTMAVLGWTLPPILTGFVAAAGGAIRTAPYARPGTEAVADATVEALADRGACFLRHHGLLAIGADAPPRLQGGGGHRGRGRGVPPSPGVRHRAGATRGGGRLDRRGLARAVARGGGRRTRLIRRPIRRRPLLRLVVARFAASSSSTAVVPRLRTRSSAGRPLPYPCALAPIAPSASRRPSMTETTDPRHRRVEGGHRPASGPGPSCSSTARSATRSVAARYATENPATGRPSPRSRRAAPADVDAAVAAARRAADDGRWSPDEPGRPQADPRPLGGPDRGQRPGDRAHRDDRRRQADHRHGRSRHARDGGLHPLARGGRPTSSTARSRRRPRARSRRSPASRWASSARSSRGTTRPRWRPGSWARRWPRATRVVIKPASTTSLSLLRIAELGSRGRHPGRRPQRRHRPRRRRRRGARAATRTSTASRSRARPRSAGGSSHYAAETNLKRVLLELGGKSPQLVFADVTDFEARGRQRGHRDLLEHGRELLGRLAADRPPLVQGPAARGGPGGARELAGRRPARSRDADRRPHQRAGHMETVLGYVDVGQARGRAGRHRWRADPGGDRRLLRPAHDLRQRPQRHDGSRARRSSGRCSR